MFMDSILTKYKEHLTEIDSLIQFAFLKDDLGNDRCSESIRKFILENAFLKTFVAWEEFLEKSFIHYLMGRESLDGVNVNRHAYPIDDEHALIMIIGTKTYLDWGNPEIVRRTSDIYFENGNPFNSVIASINQELLDLRTIRNSTAHISSTTQVKLDSVASRLLKTQVSRIEVIDLIFRVDPNGDGNQTIYKSFLLKLEIAADNIAKCII